MEEQGTDANFANAPNPNFAQPGALSLHPIPNLNPNPNPNLNPIPDYFNLNPNPSSNLNPYPNPNSPKPNPNPNPSFHTPSPSRTSYSDRFIPSRSGSNLSTFSLLDKSPSSSSGTTFCGLSSDGRDDGAAAYSMLLRTELFGEEMAGPLSPSTPEKLNSSSKDTKFYSPLSPTSKNIFRFKSGSNSKPESPYSLSPVGLDGALSGSVSSPRKAPRKIPRSPYKVDYLFSLFLPSVCEFVHRNMLKLIAQCKKEASFSFSLFDLAIFKLG